MGVGLVEARVDAQAALALSVGQVELHLQQDGACAGQAQRGFEHEFVDAVEACVLGGAQGELDECGPGQQDVFEDGVVREPGLGRQGQPSAEQKALGIGQGGDGLEQGVVCALAARGKALVGLVWGLGPEALVLEGVGGQLDPLRALGLEEGLPVDLDAASVEPAQCGQ